MFEVVLKKIVFGLQVLFSNQAGANGFICPEINLDRYCMKSNTSIEN